MQNKNRLYHTKFLLQSLYNKDEKNGIGTPTTQYDYQMAQKSIVRAELIILILSCISITLLITTISLLTVLTNVK